VISNALQFAITMCLKFKEEITNPSTPVILIEDDSRITFELFLFTSNNRREVCGVLDFLFLFKENLKKEKFITCCL